MAVMSNRAYWQFCTPVIRVRILVTLRVFHFPRAQPQNDRDCCGEPEHDCQYPLTIIFDHFWEYQLSGSFEISLVPELVGPAISRRSDARRRSLCRQRLHRYLLRSMK